MTERKKESVGAPLGKIASDRTKAGYEETPIHRQFKEENLVWLYNTQRRKTLQSSKKD